MLRFPTFRGTWIKGAIPWCLAGALVPAQGSGGPAVRNLARFRGVPASLAQASGIGFCQEVFLEARDPALRRLEGCWIVAGARGVHAITPEGKAAPVAGIPGPAQACQALALPPPGPVPLPQDAPRLVCSLDGGARLAALGIDGGLRELALGQDPGHPAQPARTARALAMDREGNVYAACASREVIRIDLSGQATVLARLPAAGADGPLALARDSATGDLYVGEAGAVHQVTVSGGVLPVLAAGQPDPERPDGAPPAPGFEARHLALRGRELFIADPGRPAVLAFHLDTRRLATLLDSAGQGPTRFGPVRHLRAALGGAGPLAFGPGDRCLLALEKGFATLDLPPGPVTRPALAPQSEAPVPSPRRRPPAPPVRPTARQRSLERFRAIQLGVRNYKKAQRLARRQEALEQAGAPQAPAGPAPRRPCRAQAGPRLGGLFHLLLLGLGSLSDRSVLLVLAQAPPAPGPLAYLDRTFGNAQAGLDPLGPACAAPQLAGRSIAPCDGGYQAGVRAQLDTLRVEAARLLVDPATLGAGQCLRGEAPADARARIALAQNDVLADYEKLSADAAGLWYQLVRDGFLLLVPGAALLAGQAAAAPGGNGTLQSPVPSFVLGEAGAGLITAGFAVQAAGDAIAKLSFKASAYQAKYQKWANSQTERLLDCTGVPAPRTGGPQPPLAAGPESPLPAIADAMQKIIAGCSLARQRGLLLAVCSPDTITEFQGRNSTLAERYHSGIVCLVSGILQGVQATCPDAPLADARTRSDTFATFNEFQAEIAEAAAAVFETGNAFYTLSESSVVAANAETLLGLAAAARGALITADTFSATGNGLFSAGYELFRIGALARSWAARINRAFNADSRDQLDRKEALARSAASTESSSTGPAAVQDRAGPAAADPAPVPATDAEPDATPVAVPIPSPAWRLLPPMAGWP